MSEAAHPTTEAQIVGREMTPRQIVQALDRYIVGQRDAKRAVAIAVRNRWRRQQLPKELRDEVAPKNIILIGPTGVGKTEVARRLAGLVRAPFVKVEASKYTEVGYVGRDVESMVRDLVDVAINMVKLEKLEAHREAAAKAGEDRLLDLLVPGPSADPEARKATRERLREKLQKGELDEREVEVQVTPKATPSVEIFSPQGIEHMGFDFQSLFDRLMPGKSRERVVRVAEARRLLEQEEAEKLLDMDKVKQEALARTQESGIVFIDELDKIAGREGTHGPDVSREGVQRDLLPIVEGSTVSTRYGMVKTDHVLFIAAGAFHVAKPSDLIPELQGRFPIRVELQSLTRDDFVRILKEPENALTKQYAALLRTEGVAIEWMEGAVEEIAAIAAEVNGRAQDIGARRLHTVIEKLLEDLLFEAPDCGGATVPITRDYVRERLQPVLADEDLSRYIL